MGVKEFRERFSSLADGDRSIDVTKNGRVVGRFVPEGAKEFDFAAWSANRETFRETWKANTPDWRERLAAYGLDEDGEPFSA